MITILRTGAGSVVAPGVIQFLREAGAAVVAADMDPHSIGFSVADAHVRVPAATESGFVAALLDACERFAVGVLFPDVDEEMPPIAAARARFERRGVRVLLSREETIRTCLDKWRLGEALSALGIGTPRVLDPHEVQGGQPPFFVKPRFGRGARGARRVDDRAALGALGDDFLVQEYLAGTEYTIDTLSDLDGCFLYAVVRERVEVESGISTKGRVVEARGLEDQARRIVEGLGIVGPGCLQCIVASNGVARFIDCNPRLGGGVSISVAAGAPILRDVVRLLSGERVEAPVTLEYGVVRSRRWAESYRASLANLRAVLFDLDYTLYDQETYVAGALDDVANAVAEKVEREAAALGDSLRASWRRQGPAGDHLFDDWLAGMGVRSESLVALCVDRFRRHSPASLGLHAGAQGLLRALRARGLRLGIVTDGHADMQREKVRLLGLADLVDVIVYTREHRAEKPDPKGLLEACDRLGVAPTDALFVGDAAVDVVAARRAGMRAARIRAGFYASQPDSPGAAPDLSFPDLASFARLLA